MRFRMIFDRTCISKYSGHISQTGHAAKTAEWYSLGNWMEDLGHAARAYKRYFELPLQKSQLGRNPMFKKMVTTSVIASTAIVTAAMLFITIFPKIPMHTLLLSW